jgi:KipI family sensor histidine kinase inhibitor
LSSRSLRASPLGDSAITVSFGTERSPQLLARIHAAARALRRAGIQFVDDVVPAYLALTVFYDAQGASYEEIAEKVLHECEGVTASDTAEASREHIIPVTYDGADIGFVADSTGLSVDAVVARHSERAYSVDLLGFVPGFAYLSELDPVLQLPRRAQPRPRVARGSVAIAAAQTGVYPLDTPGGWHIIGRTSTVMFDPAREPPVLLVPGDTVRFRPIS